MRTARENGSWKIDGKLLNNLRQLRFQDVAAQMHKTPHERLVGRERRASRQHDSLLFCHCRIVQQFSRRAWIVNNIVAQEAHPAPQFAYGIVSDETHSNSPVTFTVPLYLSISVFLSIRQGWRLQKDRKSGINALPVFLNQRRIILKLTEIIFA